MLFKEPIFEQPIRLIADDHICEDVDDLSLWLGIPIEECQQRLLDQNGRAHMTIRGYDFEPADPVNPRRYSPIVVITRGSGEVQEFQSLYEASVKMGVDYQGLLGCKNGKGPWRESFYIIPKDEYYRQVAKNPGYWNFAE